METVVTTLQDPLFLDPLSTPSIVVKLTQAHSEERVYTLNLEKPGFKQGWLEDTVIREIPVYVPDTEPVRFIAANIEGAYSPQSVGCVSASLAHSAIKIADPERWLEDRPKMRVGELRRISTQPLAMVGMELLKSN